MLSRLTPAKRCIRTNLVKSASGALSKDAGLSDETVKTLWMTVAEKEAVAADFANKMESAGIKSFNIIPQGVTDPVVKAGLGQILEFNDYIPVRMQGKCSEETLEKALNIYNDMKADGAKAYQIK